MSKSGRIHARVRVESCYPRPSPNSARAWDSTGHTRPVHDSRKRGSPIKQLMKGRDAGQKLHVVKPSEGEGQPSLLATLASSLGRMAPLRVVFWFCGKIPCAKILCVEIRRKLHVVQP